MTSPVPSVSIVIPAYNEERTIRSCVLAALGQTAAAHEIIVVDNRSTDATAAIVTQLQRDHPLAPIRLVTQDLIQGLIPTRDAGFNAATGDVLGRIDADTVVDPTWVHEVQLAFTDTAVAASTGPMSYYDMPLVKLGLRADDRVRRGMLKLCRQYSFVFGSNMALRASAWRQIRSEVCADVDDELHEDIDLSVHLQQHGLRVTYVSTMVAGMSARRIDDSPRDYLYYVTRFERTYQRHGVRNAGVRAPMVLFLAIYPALKMIRLSRAAFEV
ncbi:MAG: glycosyltransferase family 2 protein [Glaciihabitans sp.]|nr:glycosyltransferase family 2 protein [Glaciihabitans sp.]